MTKESLKLIAEDLRDIEDQGVHIREDGLFSSFCKQYGLDEIEQGFLLLEIESRI